MKNIPDTTKDIKQSTNSSSELAIDVIHLPLEHKVAK